jgi:tetratricopeptide (TPR) repeat protein
MSLKTQLTVMGMVLITVTTCDLQARAQNDGQADLDKATQLKISATSLADLSAVIRLCESAMEKGLDEDNAPFARTLLAATRIQRGMQVAEQHVFKLPPDPDWRESRKFALNDLNKGLGIDPEQPQAHLMVAKLNLLLPEGDRSQAQTALDEAVRLSPEEPRLQAQALILRASLAEEPEKKLADLSEAIRVAPVNVTPGEPDLLAAAIRGRAGLYVDQGDYEKALPDLDRAVDRDPNHAPTQVARAMVLIELERYDDALVSLDKAQQLRPNSVIPLIQKARVHGMQENFRAALHVLDQAHELESTNTDVLLLRATVYHELEESEKALQDIDIVLSLSPGMPEATRLRAMVLAGEGKFDEAIADMEKLRQSDATDITDQLRLAMFYSADKNPEKAIELYSKALEQEPENLFALRGRADALLGVGKQAEAIKDYEKAMELVQDDSGILNNLSWVLSTSPDENLRDGKRALELALKACELTEYKQAHILSTLAAAYAELGDFETAIKWSQKAVDIGDDAQQEALENELESYKAGKPVRELLPAPQDEEEEKEEDNEGEAPPESP